MAESQAIPQAGSEAGAGTGADIHASDDDALYCYRHPDRETRLRCRTCDRPICSKCAILTPVGYRCPEDGRVKDDPFTTLKPQQLVLAVAIALLGGAIAGFISDSIGFFSIVISFFAGGFIVDTEDRVVGLKRGPVMVGIVLGGIVVGGLAGFAYGFWTFFAQIPGDMQEAMGPFLQQQITFALISAGAACVGAWRRLR